MLADNAVVDQSTLIVSGTVLRTKHSRVMLWPSFGTIFEPPPIVKDGVPSNLPVGYDIIAQVL